jgi:hypothetical protein
MKRMRYKTAEEALVKSVEPGLQQYLKDSIEDWIAAGTPSSLTSFVTFDIQPGSAAARAILSLDSLYRGLVK